MALIKCSECGKEMSDQVNTCPHCGYSNKSYTYCSYCGAKCVSDNYCNNCGQSMNPNMAYQAKKGGQNPLALAGGITGICSFFIDPVGLAAITAIILSSIGLNQVSTTGAKGKGWAITGIVCGIIEAIFKVILLVSYFK